MLKEIKDYIKTLGVAEHYSVGKIDGSKDKSLGVYGDSTTRRVESVGRNSSYGTMRIRILLHWNKSAVETEEASKNLFDNIRYITDLDLSSAYIEYIDWDSNMPVFVGTDANGVYEYVVSGIVFYRR
jgi:hypothetical protein